MGKALPQRLRLRHEVNPPMFRPRLLCLLTLLTLCVGQASAFERCVWREEFGGAKLNTRFWTPETNFVRNVDAAQIYTDRPKNLALKGGSLRLTSYRETYENGNYKPESKSWLENRKSADYTSGSVNSRGKVEFRYGRVEIRARIEHGRGVWPALWLIGNNPGGWPACGEIDILEYISQEPNNVQATFHYTKNGQYIHPSKAVPFPKMDGGWHIYGMNWTPEKIELTVDKKVTNTLNLADVTSSDGSNPFTSGTFFLILNQAIDGWSETPVAEDYPKTFSIDYVRLYQDRQKYPDTLLKIAEPETPKKTSATRTKATSEKKQRSTGTTRKSTTTKRNN